MNIESCNTCSYVGTMHRAPAAERNKGPILEVLLKILGANFSGRFLEVATGTGQHISHFANTFTKATFQPTEYEEQELSRFVFV